AMLGQISGVAPAHPHRRDCLPPLPAREECIMSEPQNHRAGTGAPPAPDIIRRAPSGGSPPCVFIVNAAGFHSFVSPSLCLWLNRTEADLLGRTVFDVWPRPLADQDAIENLRVLRGEHLEQDETRPRGKETRTVHTIKSPLRDEHGAVQGVV